MLLLSSALGGLEQMCPSFLPGAGAEGETVEGDAPASSSSGVGGSGEDVSGRVVRQLIWGGCAGVVLRGSVCIEPLIAQVGRSAALWWLKPALLDLPCAEKLPACQSAALPIALKRGCTSR